MAAWELCETCGFFVDDDGACAECSFDAVTKPSHYNHSGGVECIDYIKQVLGLEGFVAYCRGNVIKYNHRAFYKGNATEDLKKAEVYLKWANEALEEMAVVNDDPY